MLLLLLPLPSTALGSGWLACEGSFAQCQRTKDIFLSLPSLPPSKKANNCFSFTHFQSKYVFRVLFLCLQVHWHVYQLVKLALKSWFLFDFCFKLPWLWKHNLYGLTILFNLNQCIQTLTTNDVQYLSLTHYNYDGLSDVDYDGSCVRSKRSVWWFRIQVFGNSVSTDKKKNWVVFFQIISNIIFYFNWFLPPTKPCTQLSLIYNIRE